MQHFLNVEQASIYFLMSNDVKGRTVRHLLKVEQVSKWSFRLNIRSRNDVERRTNFPQLINNTFEFLSLFGVHSLYSPFAKLLAYFTGIHVGLSAFLVKSHFARSIFFIFYTEEIRTGPAVSVVEQLHCVKLRSVAARVDCSCHRVISFFSDILEKMERDEKNYQIITRMRCQQKIEILAVHRVSKAVSGLHIVVNLRHVKGRCTGKYWTIYAVRNNTDDTG